MSGRIKKVALGAAVAALSVGAGAVPRADAATSGACWSNPAARCTPSMSTSWAPWTSTWSQGPQYWTIPAGTKLDMVCWNTGATRLNTAKWFYVRSTAYPFTAGYVPANAVANQIIVGHC